MVRSGSSYLSQNELPLTLGLGKETKAELLSIRWPSNTAVKFKDIEANQTLFIDEEKGIVRHEPWHHNVQ
jgi:hypothetical protein